MLPKASNIYQAGFTLIELLVVMAILGVLSVGLLSVIDPVDKINGANDSKVQQDVRAIAIAMESYAVNHGGTYPTDQDVMITSGDLKLRVSPPSGYTCGTGATAYNIVGGVTGSAYCELKSKKYKNAVPIGNYWKWCSTTGKAGPVVDNQPATCPQ